MRYGMGMKVVSVQNMISWSCFQLVKNAISDDDDDEPVANIKLIHFDGVVKIYHRPIHVSEVMLEFPKHLVCRSDSFYIGQKIPPLSEHDQLQLGHKYFLLPKPFFHSALSFLTIASFFTSNSNSFHCQRPFDIQRTPSGCLRIRVSDEFISRLHEQGAQINTNTNTDTHTQQKQQPVGKICTTPQLAKDYTHLARRRQWKPKLETIQETKKKGLGPAWTRSPDPLHHLRSIQFPYKPKIRIKLRA